MTRMVRSCVDGPVFRGDLVRWDDIGTIPFDALGAPGWNPRAAGQAAVGGAGRSRAGGQPGRQASGKAQPGRAPAGGPAAGPAAGRPHGG